jgi:hypothetical protein
MVICTLGTGQEIFVQDSWAIFIIRNGLII